MSELLLAVAALAVVFSAARFAFAVGVIGLSVFSMGAVGRVVSRKQVGWCTGCMMGTTFGIPGILFGAIYGALSLSRDGPSELLGGFIVAGIIGGYVGGIIADRDFV